MRGLSSTLFKKEGYSLEEIRKVMAQESVKTTAGYIDAEALPYEEVTVRLKE